MKTFTTPAGWGGGGGGGAHVPLPDCLVYILKDLGIEVTNIR